MVLRSLVLGSSLVVLAALPAAAQRDFSAVEIESEEIRGGIYMLTGAGGNMGLSVGEDGAYLVDDQYAPLSDKILAAVKKITAEPLEFVVNTHYHGDHTGGNENLGRAGALLVAHEKVRARLARGRDTPGRETPPAPKDALPVVTFADGLSFHWNGLEIRVFAVGQGAHTDGDSIIHFVEADVFHMGDTYFADRYPYIDVPAGGRIDGVIAAADRVLAVATGTTRIIPGHGPLSTRADLQAYRDMLATVRARVGALKAEGKSLEDVVAARPTADFDDRWGGRDPNAFVGYVYETIE
jgi:glyoxylase-like metal-dependent hydrolase (beta-lactamase superfamily II)